MDGGIGASTGARSANDRSEDQRLQLHIAEYNALTNRGTYRMYFMTTLWALVAVAAAILAQVAQPLDPRVLAWGAGIVPGFLMMNLYMHIIELLVDLDYMETELRTRVTEIVGDAPFWRYDRWRQRRRRSTARNRLLPLEFRKHPPEFWEIGPLLFVAAIVAMAVVARATAKVAPWSAWDTASLVVNAAVLLVTALTMLRTMRLLRRLPALPNE